MGLRDDTIAVPETPTGERHVHLLSLTGHQDKLSSIGWAPNGSRLVTGGYDTARIWDARTGHCLASLGGANIGAVYAVDWSPDGAHILTGAGHTAWIVDATTHQVERGLTGQGLVLSVAWSPDGRLVATGSYDGTA